MKPSASGTSTVVATSAVGSPTAGAVLWGVPARGLPTTVNVEDKDSRDSGPLLVPDDGAFVRRDQATGAELGRSAVGDLPDGGLATSIGPVVVLRLPDRVLAYR